MKSVSYYLDSFHCSHGGLKWVVEEAAYLLICFSILEAILHGHDNTQELYDCPRNMWGSVSWSKSPTGGLCRNSVLCVLSCISWKNCTVSYDTSCATMSKEFSFGRSSSIIRKPSACEYFQVIATFTLLAGIHGKKYTSLYNPLLVYTQIIQTSFMGCIPKVIFENKVWVKQFYRPTNMIQWICNQ